jgi:hypothetical protein
MGTFNNELAGTNAGLTRGTALTQLGQQNQNQMNTLATGQMNQGLNAGAIGAGYTTNAQQDSSLSNADRAGQQDTINSLHNFYTNGPGPSAAQDQLRQAGDTAQAQTMAIARSGRGGVNPNAMRDAAFQNANTMQQNGQQMQILKNQEAADWRTQAGAAMGAEQAGLAGMRSGDLSNMQGNNAAGTNAANLGLGYSGLGSSSTAAGQQYGQGYAGLAEGATENAAKLRQGLLTGQSTADVSQRNANLGFMTGLNDLNVQKNAATTGAIATGGASLAQTLFGKPNDPNAPTTNTGGG